MKTVLKNEFKKDNIVRIAGKCQTYPIYVEWVDKILRKRQRKAWTSYKINRMSDEQ